MRIDRIELDDCGSPERLLVAMFKQVPDMPIPVPVAEIAAQVGITEIRVEETEGFEGALVANASKSKGAILIRAGVGKPRQRFSIGHELGHFLIPAHRPPDGGFRCTARDFNRSYAASSDRPAMMEVEANRFSAGLLMPARQFRKDLEALGGIDLEHVLHLAERYETSREATGRMYAQQHHERCAVVVSKGGKILRVYAGVTFPRMSVWNGSPVPHGSSTATFSGKPGTMSKWDEVDQGVWLADDPDRPRGVVEEQVIIQASDFRMTLLSVEEAEPNETEDEDRPRSRRFGFDNL